MFIPLFILALACAVNYGYIGMCYFDTQKFNQMKPYLNIESNYGLIDHPQGILLYYQMKSITKILYITADPKLMKNCEMIYQLYIKLRAEKNWTDEYEQCYSECIMEE